MELKIKFRKTVTDIPSLSGVETIGDKLFVVGDNAPYVFELNGRFDLLKMHLLIKEANLEGNVIPKLLKPDLEAMCKVKFEVGELIFIFGSGSKSPQRDTLFIFDPSGKIPVKKYSLYDFYGFMKIECKIASENFNIEAAVCNGETLYLFNRGDNQIIEFSLEDLFEHLENKKHFPDFKTYNISLPMFKKIQAGFSGADIIDNKIIFTASLEKTNNWIDDGEILGSYLGTIAIDKLQEYYRPSCHLITVNHVVQKIKVESVSIKNFSDEGYQLILVTDNDGGFSEMIECTLK